MADDEIKQTEGVENESLTPEVNVNEDAQEQETTNDDSNINTDEVSEDMESESDNLPKSERGQNRVQDLANERNQYQSENERLKARLAEVEKLQSSSQEGDLPDLGYDNLPYTGDYATDLEILRAEIKKEVLQESRRESQLKDDIVSLEKQYPELDSSSDKANKKLIANINKLYGIAHKGDPSLRLKDFVNDYMSDVNSSRNAGKAESLEALAEQETNTALTPDLGTKKTSRDPKDMSLEEIAQQVGYAED